MNKTDVLSFNRNIESYKNARPGYPNSIYSSINDVKKIDSNSRILEVGCGNGIATKEILSKWNPWIIGIEPGEDLYRDLVKELKYNQKVNIRNITFEDFNDDDKFDAVFSATAFHWIDKNYKYRRSYDLLKDDGALVLYWNYFGINNSQIEKELDNLYLETGFNIKNKSTLDLQNDKINERYNEIKNSNYFSVIKHDIFENILPYSAKKYVDLLKTFPDHSIEKIPKINEMYNKIINKFANEAIEMKIRINLIISKKI